MLEVIFTIFYMVIVVVVGMKLAELFGLASEPAPDYEPPTSGLYGSAWRQAEIERLEKEIYNK